MKMLPLLKQPHGLLLVILCLLLFGVETDQTTTDEDQDAILADIKYLYEEPKHYIDPDDMYVDYDGLRSAAKAETATSTSTLPLVVQESSDAASCRLDLDKCRMQRDLLTKELESQSSATETLLKKLSKEAVVDYRPYYKRLLSQLWELLRLETALLSVEHGSSTGVARQVTVVVSAGAVTSLHRCLSHTEADAGGSLPPRECDEAVSSLLDGVTVDPEEPDFATRFWEAFNQWTDLVCTLNKFELALLFLAFVFLVLVGHLVRDVIRTRRMASTVLLLLAIAFVFCCLWNWRTMIKEVEARRAADWERRGAGSRDGAAGPPPECRDSGLWSWVVGADAACQKYYSEAFLSAAEEVSIEEVVSRTAAALFLTPLRIAGREVGHFFKEFYGAVPLVYLVPASVILVLLLVIIIVMGLLITCGYAVDFPLFMGGIRPGGPPNPPPPAIDVETITRQLRQEQQQHLLESRRMMLEIGSASIASAQQAQPMEDRSHEGAVVQPILNSSYRSIESHLDQLISSRLHSILEHPPAATPDRLPLGAPPSSPPRTPLPVADRLHSSDGRSSSTPTLQRPVSFAGSVYSPGHRDCTDGGPVSPLIISGAERRLLDEGTGSCNVTGLLVQSPAAQETSDFYHDVCNVLGESFTSSSAAQMEELAPTVDNNVTPPRVRQRMLNTEVEKDPPLSPASKKFLSEVQDALES